VTTSWPRRKIGEIAQHSLGKMLDRARNQGEPKPYLRNQNVRWFGFDLSDLNVMGFRPEEEAKYTAVKGDVLICEGGYPGRAAIWDRDEPIHFQKALHRVRFHEPERNKWFLYYLCEKDADGSLRDHLSGTGIQHFTGEALDTLEMPLPPVAEQQRIVGILDEAFRSIATAKANAEKNLRNARALFESHLESAFTNPGDGWGERRLNEVARDFGRGKSKHRPRNDPRLYGGRYPFVQTGDVRHSQHRIEAYSQTYSEAGLAQSKLWPAGTLCITIAANIAETGILTFDACFPDSVIGVVADETQTSGRFLEYMLQSFKVHLQALGKGSAQANINLATFANQVFPFPGLDTQAEIVETLDLLDSETQRLESVYQRKLTALYELKRSLLQQAFSGQL
jgi:type I restriction enzyme S subunit